MITIDEIKEIMSTIKDLPKFEKMIEFTSVITQYFNTTKIKPIVVGGLSVEIYTRSHYTTSDIDLVTDGYHEFDKLLTQLEFKKVSKEWYHEDLGLAIEIPSNFLEGSYDKVYEISLKSGRTIYVIGIEDIIIHRLESACIHPNPENYEDYEWAYRMFLIHSQEIDKEYILKYAEETRTDLYIKKWYKEL